MEAGPPAAPQQGRAGGAAARGLLIAGGAYAVTHLDPGDPGSSTVSEAVTDVRSEPADAAGDTGEDQIKPGTYRVLVGAGATGDAVEADLTLEGAGWRAGNYPMVQEGATSSGVAVYRPQALAAVRPRP